MPCETEFLVNLEPDSCTHKLFIVLTKCSMLRLLFCMSSVAALGLTEALRVASNENPVKGRWDYSCNVAWQAAACDILLVIHWIWYFDLTWNTERFPWIGRLVCWCEVRAVGLWECADVSRGLSAGFWQMTVTVMRTSGLGLGVVDSSKVKKTNGPT